MAIGIATIIAKCYAAPQADQVGSDESNRQVGKTQNPTGNRASSDLPDHTHNPKDMGSTYVPLDSWIYPALDRLAALGYAERGFEGVRPWTRMQCARMIEEAEEDLEVLYPLSEDAEDLLSRLEEEFSFEIGLRDGQRNLGASLESAYARAVSVSGPALTNSYHFGQTVSYDFGRPFERGTNGQAGGAFRAEAGPFALYVRAEYQHAPSAPAPSEAVLNVIVLKDEVPIPPDAGVDGINGRDYWTLMSS
ncbi:MAG: capsule assembly Wzi family protein [Terriglobales bacterium]